MTSLGDPILDARAICSEAPATKEELEAKLRSLGWGIPIETLLRMCEGTYIVRGDDGCYYPNHRAPVEDVVRKALRNGP